MKQTLGSEGDPSQYIFYYDDYGEEKHSFLHQFWQKQHIKTRSKNQGREEKGERERKRAA